MKEEGRGKGEREGARVKEGGRGKGEREGARVKEGGRGEGKGRERGREQK